MSKLAEPNSSFVLIKPSEATTETSGGLYIPEANRTMVTAPGAGIVVAAGEEAKDWMGRDVYFDKYKGVEVERDNIKYISIDQSDLHGHFPSA